MTTSTDLKMFSDELLMAIGVKFETVEWSDQPQPDHDAATVLDRALDELVSNALAIRTVSALNGVLGVAALARQSISLRRFVDAALLIPQTSVYGDDWEVHLVLTPTGEINQVELYHRSCTLSERFQ